MARSTHRFEVAEARRVRHPVFPHIEKHYFTVRAGALPPDLRNDANARDSGGTNRQVYRDVRDSLLALNSEEGTFDLMNKGIVILATDVARIEDGVYDVTIDDGQGIVDGGHTYRIICENQDNPDLPIDQFVEVQVRTGVENALVTDIARGLNTGIQVQRHSLSNLDGAFEWIKDEIRNESYYPLISWREGDDGEYDVRDIICVLEALNIFDFPNTGQKHPISAYEKWSIPAGKFAADFEANKESLGQSTYYRLRPLLKGGLRLWDTIRHDFREVRNRAGGSAGSMRILENAPKGRKFTFPFAGLPASEYRLTKGALYPIFAAFRNAVENDPATNTARWTGGIESVLDLWTELAELLVNETASATRDIGHLPDQLGKNRGHWAYLHSKVENHLLRRLSGMR